MRFPLSSTVLALTLALAPAVLAETALAAPRRPQARLELKDLSGKPRSLHALKGKVVLLNFWATWCGPCVAELPELVSLAERYREAGLVVVAASVDDAESRDNVAAFARQRAKGLEVWVGADNSDMAAFGLGNAVPATLMLDRGGRVVERVKGSISHGELDDIIEKLLKESGTDSVPPDEDEKPEDKPQKREHPGRPPSDPTPSLPQAALRPFGKLS